jgi:hypothetical protein
MDISTILTPIAIAIVMALLLAASKKRAKIDENGDKILRLPFFYAILGGLCTIASLIIIIYGLATCAEDEIIFVLIFFSMCAGLGLPLLLAGTVMKVKILTNKLEQTNILGRTKTIMWSEIESITFGKISLELKIVSATDKIKAHVHLKGFEDLVDAIEANTTFTRTNMRIP